MVSTGRKKAAWTRCQDGGSIGAWYSTRGVNRNRATKGDLNSTSQEQHLGHRQASAREKRQPLARNVAGEPQPETGGAMPSLVILRIVEARMVPGQAARIKTSGRGPLVDHPMRFLCRSPKDPRRSRSPRTPSSSVPNRLSW
ncbi:hypothetical protein MRX96_053780 [Rhipicephalus microplus]